MFYPLTNKAKYAPASVAGGRVSLAENLHPAGPLGGLRRVLGGRMRAVLLIGVPVLWLLVLHLAPVIQLGRIAFFDRYPLPPGTAPEYTLDHILRFFTEPVFWVPFGRTFILAAATSALTLAVALPVAWLLARHTAPGSRFRRILLLMVPFWAGELVRSFSLVLFAANKGLINEGLKWAGLIDEPISILYTPFAVGAGMFYFLILYQLLPLYTAMEKLPSSVFEAAADLGAGAWQRFRRVTLPLLRPAIANGTTLVFLMATGAYSVPLLLGGTGTTLFPESIALAFNSGSNTWPLGAALSLILLIGAVVTGGLWLRLVAGPNREAIR